MPAETPTKAKEGTLAAAGTASSKLETTVNVAAAVTATKLEIGARVTTTKEK
jgi:hypothetical protein